MLTLRTCSYPYHNFPQLTAISTVPRLLQQTDASSGGPRDVLRYTDLLMVWRGKIRNKSFFNYFTPPWTYVILTL